MMSNLHTRIEEVATAKSVPVQSVVDALIAAVTASIRKTYGQGLDVEIGFSPEGSIEAYIFKEVVADGQVSDLDTQISLRDALKHDSETSIEEELGIPVNVDSLEAKCREPGQLERLYDRYGKGKELGVRSEEKAPAPLTPNASPLTPLATEWLPDSKGKLVEVPYEDKRTPKQRIADLQQEADQWADTMIAQFAEKVRNYAEVLKQSISNTLK